MTSRKPVSELKSKIFFTTVLVAVIFLSSVIIILLSPTKATTPPLSSYNCPTSEWVNCMPPLTATTASECDPVYLKWAQDSCPEFRGAAY